VLLAANTIVFFTLLTVISTTLHRRWQPIKITKNIQPQVPHRHLMFWTALEASPFSLVATFNVLRSTTTFFSSQILNSWANLLSQSVNFLGGSILQITNLQLLWVNPQIANPQNSLVFQFKSCKSASCSLGFVVAPKFVVDIFVVAVDVTNDAVFMETPVVGVVGFVIPADVAVLPEHSTVLVVPLQIKLTFIQDITLSKLMQ
jgi:hypothetical protein